MTFFFDRCVSRHLALMLGHFDRQNNITHQDDDNRFDDDTEDVKIIETISSDIPKPHWITADLSQRKNNVERAALCNSGMSIFFFRIHQKTPHFQALKILAIWPTLVSLAEKARFPTVFDIPAGHIGRINKKIVNLGRTSEVLKVR